MSPYAELHCISNFTFLQGASHPEELVQRAHELGYSALALTDECSLAGVVRAHVRARELGLPLLVGSEFRIPARFAELPLLGQERLVLLAVNRQGYGDLSVLISQARSRASKGQYRLAYEDLGPGLPDCLALWVPAPAATTRLLAAQARWLTGRFPGRCWLAAELLMDGADPTRLDTLRTVSLDVGIPLVAAGNVAFHVRSRKVLQDTLTAIRLGLPVAAAGKALAPNAERHLRSRLRLATLYPPALLEETLEIASRCRFSLDELRYEYPEEIVPDGHSPTSWLRHLTVTGAAQRFDGQVPPAIQVQLEHELALIAELRFEPYFLTVADIVGFARSRGILCQGRGSAANSAVCYCLGITEVDPARATLLFERFISRERNEPPDIDIDFEHQRREEVIQYLYRRYGRHRAALTATVVSYRARSALRDTGRALGLDVQGIDRLTRAHQWWDGRGIAPERLHEAGFDPDAPAVQRWMQLAATLMGFPRHLSQHTGGFVIARDDLRRLVPVENAAMAERTVIQWDKDDLDALGLLKVDVLALGMLTVIRRALAFAGMRRGVRHPDGTPAALRMQDIPPHDDATFEMISRADTVGVFQIESRAQMAMLPRLRPRCFYDLVVEVAIVRPGPIQGGMVHPYLRRRQGLERVSYPRDEIRPALERTLGVPIFQEQVMQVAILAAGFTPGEADALRRGMAAWRRRGGLDAFQQRLVDGMLARGYDAEFAQAIFQQIQGFGEYGFPESHAASFALLVWVSAWLKCHEPAAFLAALLDSQPMGFYAPAQLVRDARAHGVQVLPVDVCASHAGSLLDTGDRADMQPAVRLGLQNVKGLAGPTLDRILQARRSAPFRDVQDLAIRAALDAGSLQRLASSGALATLAGHRHLASWQAALPPPRPDDLLRHERVDEVEVALPAPTEAQDTLADYASLGFTLGAHPLALLRPRLARQRIVTARELDAFPDGRPTRASGLVTHRQRPDTAGGTLFITLEDDTGTVNVIVHRHLLERQRAPLLAARLLTVFGIWQLDDTGQVRHLLARRVVDHTPLLGTLTVRSRDFR